MLLDSGAQILIRQAGEEKLAGLGIPTLNIDEFQKSDGSVGEFKNESGDDRSRDLAWIIYTSGSTGRPKGVGIEQRGALALLSWAESVFTQEEMSGVLASTSWCFDLSAFEIGRPCAWRNRLHCRKRITAAEPAWARARTVNQQRSFRCSGIVAAERHTTQRNDRERGWRGAHPRAGRKAAVARAHKARAESLRSHGRHYLLHVGRDWNRGDRSGKSAGPSTEALPMCSMRMAILCLREYRGALPCRCGAGARVYRAAGPHGGKIHS